MRRLLYILTGGTISSGLANGLLVPSEIQEPLRSLLENDGRPFTYDVHSLMALDSSEMTPREWTLIAEEIGRHYDDFDAFIILHGTDTLGYAAAMLTYMLGAPKKPIVLTGSQWPLSRLGSDGHRNLHDATTYALDLRSHGVVIAFNGDILAGTRTVKIYSQNFAAFSSLDLPPLASVRDGAIHYYQSLPYANNLTVQTSYASDVLTLPILPGQDAKLLLALAKEVRILLLAGFGLGGFPRGEAAAYEDALKSIAASGKLVLLTTQVRSGGAAFNVYAVGAALDAENIVPVEDMVQESLAMKAMWALGQGGDARTWAQRILKPLAYDRLSQL